MEEKNIIGLEPAGKAESVDAKKTRLKRQADFYRVAIVHAKAGIKQGARPDALFHQALDHASWAVRSRVDTILRPTGITVGSIMPYAVSIFGFITRRQLIKPALGVLAAAGALAYYVQRRRSR